MLGLNCNFLTKSGSDYSNLFFLCLHWENPANECLKMSKGFFSIFVVRDFQGRGINKGLVGWGQPIKQDWVPGTGIAKVDRKDIISDDPLPK